ncbi:MAG: magnesium and cobalt transport protein CorA [Thiobacillus sp.]|nr:magnesium and cobalt transport protein CorA [Thiobacillus sp.]
MPELIIDCLLFHDSRVQSIAFDDISEHVAHPDRFIWVEMKTPDSNTVARLGEEFGLHELALEDAITTHQRTKLEEYGEHLFIAVRTVQLWEERLEIGETHLFAGSNFVIAIRHGAGSGYSRVAERLQAAKNGIQPGAPYALYLVLDFIVDQFKPVMDGLHERFQSLESLLIGRSELGRANLERLYALKRELTLLRDASEPIQDITQDLIRLHPEFVVRELKAYYRDVHDHAVRVSIAIGHLRNSTSDAMQFHLASLSLKQNESVQKLAGWGALLALPTVVFSLYGMNFVHMPELKWPWAYPALLLATGAAVAVLYRRLKRRGWI